MARPEENINIDEIDLDLLRSQRSYFDQEIISSGRSKSLTPENGGSPKSISPVPKSRDIFCKLRVIFKPFNELYEFNELKNQADYDMVKNVMPLFEGITVYFIKH